MPCAAWPAPPPISTRTAHATGTPPSPPSPSWPRTAPSSSSATRTRSPQEMDKRLRADLRRTGRLPPHPPHAALQPGRARRPRRPPGGPGHRASPQPRSPTARPRRAAQAHPGVPRQRARASSATRWSSWPPTGPAWPGPRRSRAPVPGLDLHPGREGHLGPLAPPGEAGRDPARPPPTAWSPPGCPRPTSGCSCRRKADAQGPRGAGRRIRLTRARTAWPSAPARSCGTTSCW